MMKNIVTILLFLFVGHTAVGQKSPAVMKTTIPDSALAQPVFNLQGVQSTAGDILDAHQGKAVLLYIWAMWCPDCIAGFPALKAFQAANPSVQVVFFSLDRDEQQWKDGIEKHALEGDHYWFRTARKNTFTNAIDLDWIPRYLLLNPAGRIASYYAVDASDPTLQTAADSLR